MQLSGRSRISRIVHTAGLPVVAGEYAKAGADHYYPSNDRVRAWLDAAGFATIETTIGDDYQHLLLHKTG